MLRLAAVLTLTLCLAACGGSEKDRCPGITCTNCSGSGDCTLSCAAGHTQTCIAHPDNGNLRCAYCN
ncbi:MAG: hypothetical protein HZB56_17845 [Deltaproteobacteria bacterium]|nr:hypothetical protein [Deltaproteobacteria bacterium]